MEEGQGFTLTELMVVIAVISILAAVIAPNAHRLIDKAKVTKAKRDAQILRAASLEYYGDMGFWPPDVNRGADPGFMKPLPWYPDPDHAPWAAPDPNTLLTARQRQVIQDEWDGPYLNKWPHFTPWAGKYDYNYWPDGATRYGVDVPAGCYAGIQRNYANAESTRVPGRIEQMLVDEGFDMDEGVNGEVQLLLVGFED